MNNKTKTALAVLSITVILVCLVQALPKYNQLQKITAQVSESTEVEGTAENQTPTSAATENISVRSGSTADQIGVTEVDYITTQEYKDNENRILAIRERTELINKDLITDLTDITRAVFNQITSISSKPDDNDLRAECQQYMTDDFYAKFKDMEFERENYMAYDTKFSDLDKEDITAYVLTAGSEPKRFFVKFSFDEDKFYVISDIKQL